MKTIFSKQLFQNSFFKITLLGAGLFLAGASICSGAVTFGWNGGTTTTPTTASTSGSDSHITAGSVSQGNNVGSATLNNTSASSTTDYASASGQENFGVRTATSASYSSSSSTYFSVTLTPIAGYAIQLNSISLGSRGTGTGPTTIGIYSSIDNYATAIASTSASADSNWHFITPVSGSSLTGSDGTAVEYRIYASVSGTASSANWRIDDISFTVAAIPVPEPATWGAISGIGLLGLCAFRTWREQKQKLKERGVHAASTRETRERQIIFSVPWRWITKRAEARAPKNRLPANFKKILQNIFVDRKRTRANSQAVV